MLQAGVALASQFAWAESSGGLGVANGVGACAQAWVTLRRWVPDIYDSIPALGGFWSRAGTAGEEGRIVVLKSMLGLQRPP